MKKRVFIPILVVIIAVICLGGCDFLSEPISVEDRIEQFEDDLNASSRSASDLSDNFSSRTSQKSQMTTLAYWDDAFPQDLNYSFSNIGSTSATLTVTGAYEDTVTVTYTMEEDDAEDNYILTFNWDDGTNVVTISSVQPAL